MTGLQQLAAGLDALDDLVRSRMRQAIADLKTRQDQIDASLDRPGDLNAAPPPRPASSGAAPGRREPDTTPLNEDEGETADAEALLTWRQAAAAAVSSPDEQRNRDDEGPPATWLVR